MQYLITFMEGIISFISPCMLPMLPLYISYFAGSKEGGEENKAQKRDVVLRAVFFVLGFTLVFCLMGVFAGTVGRFLTRYQTWINIVCGAIVIVLGLAYLNVIPLNFLKGIRGQHKITGVFSAFLFGIIYSVSLTPCIGAFLGAAIMMASASGSTLQGLILLLLYSLGLGIPFVVSALLLDRLMSLFTRIKKHYRVINIICGAFLIIVGLLMMFGLLSRLSVLLR